MEYEKGKCWAHLLRDTHALVAGKPRLARRILKYRDELLLWLQRPEVAATNNAAERALRPAVITRKTSFGRRPKKGALDFARRLSLIRSWEQQGVEFFSTAHDLLAPS